MHKMKILNSFSATIFNRNRIQYKAGALLDTDFSEIFFFLPSITERVEDTNKCMNSVNLMPIDIEPSEFGENFVPSTLDFENSDKKKNRESLLKVLGKIVDLINSNFQKNEDGLLASKPRRNEDILWVAGKQETEDQFALSY